jgi:hypothetical protein
MASTPEDLQRVVVEIEEMTVEKRRSWENRAKVVVREALAPVGSRSADAFIV